MISGGIIKKTKFKSRKKTNLVGIIEARKKGKAVYLNLGHKKIIAKVYKNKNRNIDTRHDVSKKTIKIKGTKWLKKSTLLVAKTIQKIFISQLRQQLNRRNI